MPQRNMTPSLVRCLYTIPVTLSTRHRTARNPAHGADCRPRACCTAPFTLPPPSGPMYHLHVAPSLAVGMRATFSRLLALLLTHCKTKGPAHYDWHRRSSIDTASRGHLCRAIMRRFVLLWLHMCSGSRQCPTGRWQPTVASLAFVSFAAC